jgi:hypothetical protein
MAFLHKNAGQALIPAILFVCELRTAGECARQSNHPLNFFEIIKFCTLQVLVRVIILLRSLLPKEGGIR